MCLCSLVIKRIIGNDEIESLNLSIGCMTDQEYTSQDEQETDKERFQRLARETMKENEDKYALMAKAD